jgi:hypothetical protein
MEGQALTQTRILTDQDFEAAIAGRCQDDRRSAGNLLSNAANCRHMALTARPAAGELSDRELEKLTGGTETIAMATIIIVTGAGIAAGSAVASANYHDELGW